MAGSAATGPSSIRTGSALRFGPGADLLKALSVALPRGHLTAIFTLKGRMLSPVAQAFANRVRDAAKPLA
jgi:hypothetical protein